MLDNDDDQDDVNDDDWEETILSLNKGYPYPNTLEKLSILKCRAL